MTVSRRSLNHVGVRVDDLDAAIRFYAEGFGLERIPAPSFGPPVVWLRAGSLQLHLTETQVAQPSPGHFALEVDDFGAVYRWATAAGVLSRAADGSAVFELPGGECQMYLHDPGGTSSRSATRTPHGGGTRSPGWFASRISIRRTPTPTGQRSFSIAERR